MVGRLRVAADLGTTAGLAWLTGQLVQYRQLDAVDRIQVPEPLTGHGVPRMVSVPIQAECRRALGVLEIGSAEAGEFSTCDLSFLQGIANSVAMAVGLHASRTDRAELIVDRRAALTGQLDTAVDRQSLTGISYQQDAQGGAG